MTEQPRTEAGRRMLYNMGLDDPIVDKVRSRIAIRNILAIEAEAAAPLDERYRALVEAATLTSEWLDENYPDTDVQRELNDALADLGDDSDD